jgi:hypothetical protein
MVTASRTLSHDTANDTGPTASFSARQNPQRSRAERVGLGRLRADGWNIGTPAVLTSPAASHLTPSPSPRKHCSSDIMR